MTSRIEPEMVKKLDTLVERFSEEQGLNITRVDLIRQVIRQYMEREVAEAG